MKPDARRPLQEDPDDMPGAWLSALVDGHGDADAACSRWRDDPALRRDWHAYHLIGDVMRSEDLATRPARDAAFLAGVRARLAAEPVVLAPTRRRQAWMVPAAAAAGFAAVAGVMVVVRLSQPAPVDRAAAQLAQQEQTVAPRGARPEMPVTLASDPSVEPYVRMHRPYGSPITLTISVPAYPVQPAEAVPARPAR